jgi:hypothetical protein
MINILSNLLTTRVAWWSWQLNMSSQSPVGLLDWAHWLHGANVVSHLLANIIDIYHVNKRPDHVKIYAFSEMSHEAGLRHKENSTNSSDRKPSWCCPITLGWVASRRGKIQNLKWNSKANHYQLPSNLNKSFYLGGRKLIANPDWYCPITLGWVASMRRKIQNSNSNYSKASHYQSPSNLSQQILPSRR